MYVWGHVANLRAEHPWPLAGGGLEIHPLLLMWLLPQQALVELPWGVSPHEN